MYHYKGPCCQLVGDWADGGFTYGRWVYADGSMFMGKFGGAAADSKPTAGSYFYSSSSLVQEGHFAKDGSWVGHRDPAVGKVRSDGGRLSGHGGGLAECVRRCGMGGAGERG